VGGCQSIWRYSVDDMDVDANVGNAACVAFHPSKRATTTRTILAQTVLTVLRMRPLLLFLLLLLLLLLLSLLLLLWVINARLFNN